MDQVRTPVNTGNVLLSRNRRCKAVNYEMDITAQMSWDSVDLDPVFSLTLFMSEENVFRFEILAEDEWQAKLNHILGMA